MRFEFAALGLAFTVLATPLAWSQGELLISEFMADNSRTLRDQDSEYTDWVEIVNVGNAPASLEGYHLTDDEGRKTQWRFPAVTLEPSKFLMVFCSGHDRRDPASELHANFKLNNANDDVLLVAPDGTTVVSGFRGIPEQQADYSYGLGTTSRFFTPLAAGSPARVRVPSADSGLDWTQPEFDDSTWRQGDLAVGFGITGAEAALIGTDVRAEMAGINASIHIRIPFDLPDVPSIEVMKLRMKYDDGFAAFLNGTPVAGGNAPAVLAWNSVATRTHAATVLEEIDISQHVGALRPGRNVLAIQGLNTGPTGNDLFMLPELKLVHVGKYLPSSVLYFPEPTPREPNGGGFVESASWPLVSQDEGIYVDRVQVELAADLAGGVVRYTLDGKLPTEASPAYTAPLDLTNPTRLVARVFKEGVLPGPPVAATYVIVSQAVKDFSSNLPLVVCLTFGKAIGGNCGGGPYTPGHIMVIYPGENGQATLTDQPAVSRTAQFRRRGSSTCGQEKYAFNVEVLDLQGRDREVDVFDFPRESDYIMYAPNNFDRALIRNPIAYWMSREVGRWAARTRNVECIFHSGAGPVNFNTRTFTPSYMGVYNFMEKNKQHPEKIDVAQITPQDKLEPEVSGGYVMRRDRVGPDEIAISGGGYGSLVFVYPKLPTTVQRTYMTQVLNRAIASLNPRIGKQEDNPLIDFDQWIDHHILNWYPKNVDAFRLSGYFHKDRNGPLVMGPVWDYDRTMGNSDDDRAANPEGWDNNQSGDGGTRYFQAGDLGSWYSKLFNNQPPIADTPWNIAYRARWRELRRGPLRTENILAQIDEWAEELAEPGERNFIRWPGLSPRFGSLQGEMDHLKDWLAKRADWIDSQFTERPRFNPEAGAVDPGAKVEILIGSGATIYYTVDGSDPKAANGEPSPGALTYAGPITIDINTRVRTRGREAGGPWSALVEGLFVTEDPNVMITELMYNPAPPTPAEDPQRRFSATNMEFIEISNIGSRAVPLVGVRFGKGVTFSFDEVSPPPILGPGESLVVVPNPAAFAARYGNGVRVGGTYRNSLTEAGEPVNLIGPLDDVILEFTYSPSWYPQTNGGGPSLVNADPLAPPAGLSTAARWKPSDVPNGTPGVYEGGEVGGMRRPGDANGDGRISLSDAVRLLRILFQGAQDTPCAGVVESPANRAVLDWGGDSRVDVSDLVQLLQYMFLAGPEHAGGAVCKRVSACPDSGGCR